MVMLLVEDDLDRMKKLKECWESRSVQVVTAESGSEARNILKYHHFDLICSDVNMPFGSGYALAENILKDGTKGSTPLFMYSSSKISDDNKELAHEVGVDACIKSTYPEDIVNESMAILATL
jgi:CheY-like chemotaxis protein